MSYSIKWGQKTPGHLLFLIDQSGSMQINGNDQKVVDAVHTAITEVIQQCISGPTVKNRVYITIIGYGNENGVSIVKEGWADSFVKDLMACKNNGTKIIEKKFYGNTPMADAFELAEKSIKAWLKAREQAKATDPQVEIPAPIVINITDGMPDDAPQNNVQTISAAKNVLGTNTPDGNVIVLNIHLSESGNPIYFPQNKVALCNDEAGEFLFEISSEMNDRFIEVANAKGLEGVFPGSKGFIANAKGDTLVRFITFGSAISGTQKAE